jgi:hypothetical protein
VNKVRSDIRKAAFMRIQVLSDSMLCLVVKKSRRFLDYKSPKMKAIPSFETSVSNKKAT